MTGRDPEGVWSAPGRVNLIGEHTDYNDGLVLPFALPLRTAIAAGRRPDNMLVIRSLQVPGPPVAAAVQSLAPNSLHGWSAYVAGVVWSLRSAGHDVAGLDLVVDGGVPAGSGLSSSAALECATAIAAADIYNLDVESGELARHARHAENAFVGVPCGLMDQMASMVATRGHALFFDTRSGSVEQVVFDPAGAGLRVLVLDTHTRHAHAEGAYAERRQACAAAR
jgi:galactokinase